MTARPYVYMQYSPALSGKAREFGHNYRGHRVIETTDGNRPASVRSKTVVRVIRDRGGLNTGTTARSDGYREARFCEHLADHLNLLHQVRLGIANVSLARVAAEDNAELQRELIEAYPGGWDGYVADVGATTIQSDDYGTLIEIATAASEPIRAVRVTCPSTGRQYALRVPPQTETAHAGVAWTFGVPAALYQPVAQS